MILTAEIGHGLELFLPELRDLDGLALQLRSLGRHSLRVGVLEDLRKVLGVECVHDIEEVLPWRPLVLRKSVWKERQELFVVLEGWPEVLDRQLVVVRHLDELDRGLLHQLLLAREHFSEEVFVDGCLVG